VVSSVWSGARHAPAGWRSVAAFLSTLATAGHVSAPTQNQALSALVFLYSEVLVERLDRLNGVVRGRSRHLAVGVESAAASRIRLVVPHPGIADRQADTSSSARRGAW
jgi:hypothetical protein